MESYIYNKYVYSYLQTEIYEWDYSVSCSVASTAYARLLAMQQTYR